jgi:hypothetical protein
VSCFCEKLVAEAGDSLWNQRKGNVCRWSEDVTMDTRVWGEGQGKGEGECVCT